MVHWQVMTRAQVQAAPDVMLERFCTPHDGDPAGVVLVVAHPDDETIGAGGHLAALPDLTVAFVTDGAPRSARPAGFATRAAYARCRRDEREQALELAGVSRDRVHELGIVDQDASHELVALTTSVLAMLRSIRPAIVLTHAYEGGHPDHDATAFAVQAALCLLGDAGEPHPAALEMTSYHAGPRGICTGEFLPAAESSPAELRLDSASVSRKRAMLGCYVSQRDTLAYFGCERERFRIAPHHDFRRPPHDGRLFYEYFDWGITGPAWRHAAGVALRGLGLALGDDRQ